MKYISVAVSYTHLDVYTRQILGQDNESQVATKGGEVATMGSKTATKKNDKVRCEVKNGKT